MMHMSEQFPMVNDPDADLSGVADEQFIQQLANQFFKAPPVPTATAAPATGSSATAIPASVAGSGISPSAGHQGNGVDIKDPQTSLPDPHFAGTGHVPPAVAGSGRSPSYIDPLGNGGMQQAADPRFNAGSRQNSESRFNAGSQQVGPVKGGGLQPGGLQPAGGWQPGVGALSGGLGVGQLPFSTDPSYYFLGEKSPFGAYLPEHAALPAQAALPAPPYDVNQVRRDFPILHQHVNGRPLVWLDNAATTQKPQMVIDRISHYYSHDNSNIHRAAHELAARSTDAYEGAREKVMKFLNAGSVNEIVFVRGATEAINLVAKSWGHQYLQRGDEIIVSHLEHHANIVPWQQLAAEKDLKIRVIPVDDDGQVLLDEYSKLLSNKTKLVSFTQVSNALGTITPAQKMVEMAHAFGAKALVDGAQAVSHMPVDVRALDADWYVFSGHKVFGPTGIGVLYGKEDILNATEPWQGGGNMIKDVTFEHTTYHNAPGRFEAGTGNIADAIGLGAAIDYVTGIGMHLISQYEHYLLQYATRLLLDIPGLHLIGTAPDKAGVLSFVIDGYRNEDIGSALNANGIAVRSGHHCAQPILRRFGHESSVRPSLALYNTCSDIDALVSSLHRLTAGRRH
jgi:cysteine desulfurase/selenocysteine lyase